MKYHLLTSYFKKNLHTYLPGIFVMFLASYTQTYFPKVLGDTIDILKHKSFNSWDVYRNIGFMLLISTAVFIFTYIWRQLVIGNARKFECDTRQELYQHFQKLSPEFYSTRKTGDLIAYGINDIQSVRMALGPASAMTFNGLVVCASSIYFMMMSIDFRLTLITLAPIPIVIFMMTVIGKKIQSKFLNVQELFGEISDRVQENISGIRIIKAYVREEKEMEEFDKLSRRMSDANIELSKYSSALNPIIESCFSVSFVVNLIFGGTMVLNKSISLGDFVAFNTYLAMIMAPIISIGRVVNIFQRGTASLSRLNEIFTETPGITDGEPNVHKEIKGNIELKNLTFYYEGCTIPALNNVSIKIEEGRTIGIIGRTGSGKSTLANLLLKLYNAPMGTVFLDDQDINNYSLECIRNSFGFVPQDVFLFSATVRQNINFFKDIYSDEDIESASKFSQLFDSISSFPNGFDTVIGERGVNLSGGQKQRLSIARAVIRDPAILILDDALSAVDTITESHILRNFEQHRKNKTTLVISNRVSAIQNTDEIIVMSEGSIIERGTHRELLNKRGHYYDIYLEQAKKKESA